MTSEQIQDLWFLIRMHRSGTMLSREGLNQLVDPAELALASQRFIVFRHEIHAAPPKDPAP